MAGISWSNPCTGGEALHFGHLGGTSTGGDPDSWFPELWDWLVREFRVGTALDVGCGLGFFQLFVSSLGVEDFGLEGCGRVIELHKTGRVTRWDAFEGPYRNQSRYDLVWSSEFAEHVADEDSVVETIVGATGKVLAFCAAPPGAGGYHHVNCRSPEHWVGRFEAAGLKHSPALTEHARGLCGEAFGRGPNNYFRRSGLVFTV